MRKKKKKKNSSKNLQWFKGYWQKRVSKVHLLEVSFSMILNNFLVASTVASREVLEGYLGSLKILQVILHLA